MMLPIVLMDGIQKGARMRLKNRPRVLPVLIVGVLYVALWGWVVTRSPLLLVVLLGYTAICVLIANWAYRRDIRDVGKTTINFRQRDPFSRIGVELANPNYVFSHGEDVQETIRLHLAEVLASQLSLPPLASYEVIDRDRELISPETRQLQGTVTGPTNWGTSIYVLLEVTKWHRLHSVRWWLLLRGYPSRQSVLFFHAFAPVAVPFWIVPYLRGDIHYGSTFCEVYDAFFNINELVTRVRMIQRAIVDGLVARLEELGVDTSDLKQQRVNMINLNVSGGRVSLGNIVQGRMNVELGKGPRRE